MIRFTVAKCELTSKTTWHRVRFPLLPSKRSKRSVVSPIFGLRALACATQGWHFWLTAWTETFWPLCSHVFFDQSCLWWTRVSTSQSVATVALSRHHNHHSHHMESVGIHFDTIWTRLQCRMRQARQAPGLKGVDTSIACPTRSVLQTAWDVMVKGSEEEIVDNVRSA